MLNIAKQVFASWLNPNPPKEAIDITIKAINLFKNNLLKQIKDYPVKFNVSKDNNTFNIDIKDNNKESVYDISSNISISVQDDTTIFSGSIIDQNFNEEFDNINFKNYQQEINQAFQAILDFIKEDVNDINNIEDNDDLNQENI